MKNLDWRTVVFFAVVHILAIYGIFYIASLPKSERIISIYVAVIMYLWGMFSTTAGDHRYYTHRSYKCGAVFQILLFPGKVWSIQFKTQEWVMAHKDHHAYTDTPMDPYDATQGFWHPHFLWILKKRRQPKLSECPGYLRYNPFLQFQERFYIPLEIFFAAILPSITTWYLCNNLMAGFFASATRLMFQGHATGLVNSYAHMFGSQNYSLRDSSRDAWVPLANVKSFLISIVGVLVALLTLGEGWAHNRHHGFDYDWRCGTKWYHPDPTKWLLWLFSVIGIVWDLRYAREEDEQAALKETRRQKLELQTT